MLAILLSPIYFLILYWACRRWYKLISSFKIQNKRLDFYLKHFSWSIFLLTLTIPLGFILKDTSSLKRPLCIIGSYWLGISLYLILYLTVIDFVRFLIHKKIKEKYNDCLYRFVCALLIVTLTAITSIYGIKNAKDVKTTEYNITINKDGGNFDELTIAFFADPQFGYNIGEYHLKQAVDIINSYDVDLVAVGGDIFDNQYSAIENPDKLIELFNEIDSKYGTYAVLGNHDVEEPIMAGFTFNDDEIKSASKEMLDFIDKSNMKLLYDEGILIDDSFYLYGRADYQRPNLGNSTRFSAKELLKDADSNYPLIVLDHEPKEYEELEEEGVDLVLSGHTHDGQLWPSKILTDIFWENPYGLYKDGDFNAITTSGLGLFGPNMRIGTISEVCIIHVKFNG